MTHQICPNIQPSILLLIMQNIYFESSDLLQIQKVVNRELRKVRKWPETNRLVLNIDKTNFVIFYSQQREITDHIVLRFGRKA